MTVDEFNLIVAIADEKKLRKLEKQMRQFSKDLRDGRDIFTEDNYPELLRENYAQAVIKAAYDIALTEDDMTEMLS